LAYLAVTRELITRGKNIIIESAAYDIIKQDGIYEGIQQGIQQGKLEEAKEAIFEILETRFELVPRSLVQTVNNIEDLFILKSFLKKALVVDSMEQFKEIISKLLEE
jgi:hypothetical protein